MTYMKICFSAIPVHVSFVYGKDNNIGMCISAVFVWLIKEDASVLMMFVGLYMMCDSRKRKKGIILFITSALYCLCVCLILKI